MCICHASIHFVFTKMPAAIEILTDLCYNMCVDNLQKARQRFGQTKYATYAPVAQLDRAQASDAWLSQVRILFGVPKNYGESQMRFRF